MDYEKEITKFLSKKPWLRHLDKFCVVNEIFITDNMAMILYWPSWKKLKKTLREALCASIR